ncbi:hypothetical protein, partial [Gordonia jinhuaensis]|uniref:hypothetical protein n=1 Tax=Gordonia jinhuaensis TaxID=1517702 RepID=UPI001E5DA51A
MFFENSIVCLVVLLMPHIFAGVDFLCGHGLPGWWLWPRFLSLCQFFVFLVGVLILQFVLKWLPALVGFDLCGVGGG